MSKSFKTHSDIFLSFIYLVLSYSLQLNNDIPPGKMGRIRQNVNNRKYTCSVAKGRLSETLAPLDDNDGICQYFTIPVIPCLQTCMKSRIKSGI